MSVIRDRAINIFPMVLLTLLSIVQALAFELLWEEIHNHQELYSLSWNAVIGWVQIVTTLLGIILIWISYATNTMRFRWLPSTLDSLFPFFVGIVQFVMVDNLGQDRISIWILALAILYAGMHGIAHFDMMRARQNDENAEFFNSIERATIKDFLPTIVVGFGLCFLSLILWITDHPTGLTGFSVLVAFSLIVAQLIIADRYWRMSMTLDSSVIDSVK